MGSCPGFLLKFGQFRNLKNSPELHMNNLASSYKIPLQARRRRFRGFGAISGAYPNPPYSNPWAIAQAFCPNSANFGSSPIHPNYTWTISQVVAKSLCKLVGGVSGALERFPTLAQIRHVQSMGSCPGFLLKFGQYRNLENSPELHMNNLASSYKIPLPARRRRFRGFGAISGTYPNSPFSNPWTIAQAFCPNSANFGSSRIHPNYTWTISQVVTKSLCKLVWGVSGGLEQFPALTQIRHVQIHGL